jgi:hypothetical protein
MSNRKPRNWKLIGSIAGAAIVIGIIGNIVDSNKIDATTAAAPAVSSTASTSPAAGDSNATASATPELGTLPNLVGKGLQSAQDAAQAAGFYGLTSHDSLGRARHQVLDRDWKVCFQTPAAGEHGTDATVDLGAVKLEEDCPAKDATAPAKASGTMPNLVGKSLAAARNALDASTSITSTDATNQDRNIFLESNWQICTQQPAAGAKLTGQPVAFTAVKFEDACP